MNKFLILGAGFVAEPVIEYLNRNNKHHITLADFDYTSTQNLAKKYPKIATQQLDVTDKKCLKAIIKDKSVILSLVPAPFHPLIAQVCIEQKVHLVTASYESDAMRNLAVHAKNAGIIILNEIGLDPGIDHLSAMEIIDHAKQKGDKIISFASWCGGIPAPDNNNNPLGYKFSWEPRGALMALLNDAVYLQNNETITVIGEKLLLWSKPMTISGLRLEGYPNRESISYIKTYGINSANSIIRGTLRYQGFSQIIQSAKLLGLLNPKKIIIPNKTSWHDFIISLNQGDTLNAIYMGLDKKSRRALEWLGCFSDTIVDDKDSALDVFCALLLKKLSYQENEKDKVILQHEFGIEKPNGDCYKLTSILMQTGTVGGYSAMAKTVGYPIAMASQLIADDKINAKGLLLPVTKEIYQPILASLKIEGIEFKEKIDRSF